MLFTNKNANIGRRKEKQCLETTKSKNLEKKSEATVIVNIVIVIGSNNHILISCVCMVFDLP